MAPLARAHRILSVAVVVVAAVLAVTGVWLTFKYRPDAARAWVDLGIPWAGTAWARLTHQVASALLLPVDVALVVVGAMASRRWQPATALPHTTVALA